MGQTNIKSPSSAKYVAKQIAKSVNRGFATRDKVLTVLNVLRNEMGIKNLKDLSEEHKEAFIGYLQEKELSKSTTSTYISMWNRIVEHANKENLKISAKEHGLSRGTRVYVNRSIYAEKSHQTFVKWLEDRARSTGDIRYHALKHSVELQRNFGLRASESFAIKITAKDLSGEMLKLTREDDTKNARPREIPVYKEEQKIALQNARQFAEQNRWHSLIPPENTKADHVSFAYQALKEFREEHPEHKDYSYHCERHAFARELYSELKDKGLEDRDARQKVSEALGHSRIEITQAYLGKEDE